MNMGTEKAMVAVKRKAGRGLGNGKNGHARRRPNRKNGLVRILEVPISKIRPAPQNERVYRPVSTSDPDIIALAESIRREGLLDPLVVTRDFVLLSGHRRLAACKLLGMKTVRCRVEPISSKSRKFLLRLTQYNLQRVKSLDEVVREEVIRADPDEAYEALIDYREQMSEVGVRGIEIKGMKVRSSISKAKRPFLDAILAILEEYKHHGALSVRQIHYYLLNAPPLIHAGKPETYFTSSGKLVQNRYANTLKCYKSADELITRARLDGFIPFDSICDSTRPVVTWDVYRSPAPFIREQLDEFLKGYWRDLQQSQPNHIEIVGEKATVEGIIRPVAAEYCIPFTLGRGYSSLPPRVAIKRRFERSGKELLILLFLSDFDPEGEDIPHSFARSMRDDFFIEEILPIKVGLTFEQAQQFNLPKTLEAKKKSSRYGKFVAKYGEHVHELEAVPPDVLQGLLREHIDRVLDIQAFNAELAREKEDAAYLEGVRNVVRERLLNIAEIAE